MTWVQIPFFTTSHAALASGALGHQAIARAELSGDLQRQVLVETTCHVDSRELSQLGLRLSRLLAPFTQHIRPLCVPLRAHRHVFANRHRHRSGDQTSDSGDEDLFSLREEAATPIIKLAVDTIASSEPRTAARSQPAAHRR